MDRFARFVIGQPWSILIGVLLLTSVFGFYATRIRIDSSVEAMLPQGDPERQYYAEVRRIFGRDDVGVVAIVTNSSIYTTETFKKIDHLTAEIRKIPEVKTAMSVMNAIDPIAAVAGTGQEKLV
jgi:predicted RND superfamily exporter protein